MKLLKDKKQSIIFCHILLVIIFGGLLWIQENAQRHLQEYLEAEDTSLVKFEADAEKFTEHQKELSARHVESFLKANPQALEGSKHFQKAGTILCLCGAGISLVSLFQICRCRNKDSKNI